jgi:hypothetical protein
MTQLCEVWKSTNMPWKLAKLKRQKAPSKWLVVNNAMFGGKKHVKMLFLLAKSPLLLIPSPFFVG